MGPEQSENFTVRLGNDEYKFPSIPLSRLFPQSRSLGSTAESTAGDSTPTAAKWKGKQRATAEYDLSSAGRTQVANSSIDWKHYEHPKALRGGPEIESEVILQIVQESVDRIRGRIRAEIDRREAEEEQLESERRSLKIKQRVDRRGSEQSDSLSGATESDLSMTSPLRRKSRFSSTSTATTTATSDYKAGSCALAGPQTPESISSRPRTRPRRSWMLNLMKRLNSNDPSSIAATNLKTRSKSSLGSVDWNLLMGRKRPSFDLFKNLKTSDGSGSSNASSMDEETIDCVSCFDDFLLRETIKVSCHSYCFDCFTRLITSACDNEQQWPPKCCLNMIPERTILANVAPELHVKFRVRMEEWNTPISERIYCSEPGCSIWVPPSMVDRGTKVAHCGNHHSTCLLCRGLRHQQDTCPQDCNMLAIKNLTGEEGWQRCYGCNAYVEHGEACQPMTCRCGARFCYVCGASWRTCGCTMEQLEAVKWTAAARRQEHVKREAREEAEMAENLRLVEEFERDEALKAELLRQEQERLEEERRREDLEERIKRENERRKNIEAKFLELRELLDNVHEMQRVTLICDHDQEESRMEFDAEEVEARLKKKQETEGGEKLIMLRTKLAQRETAFAREYYARVREEQRVEQKYEECLRAYWTDRADGDEKADTALIKFRRKMDNSCHQWARWAMTELERCEYLIAEESTIQCELKERAHNEFSKSATLRHQNFLNKKEAEICWMSVVVEERQKMLVEMGEEELDNGEDLGALLNEMELLDEDEDDSISMETDIMVTTPLKLINGIAVAC